MTVILKHVGISKLSAQCRCSMSDTNSMETKKWYENEQKLMNEKHKSVNQPGANAVTHAAHAHLSLCARVYMSRSKNG